MINRTKSSSQSGIRSLTNKQTLRESPQSPSVKEFAQCHFSGTRQTTFLPSVAQKTLSKKENTRQLACLPSVFFRHSANKALPSVIFLTLGKEASLPSVFSGTRQINKLFSLLPLKLFLLFTYNMWYSILKFGNFLYLFAIIN